MIIVYTVEEIKNIITDFTHKRIGGDIPSEVVFVHDGGGLDRIELNYQTKPLPDKE